MGQSSKPIQVLALVSILAIAGGLVFIGFALVGVVDEMDEAEPRE